jgi:hypothetical protein
VIDVITISSFFSATTIPFPSLFSPFSFSSILSSSLDPSSRREKERVMNASVLDVSKGLVRVEMIKGERERELSLLLSVVVSLRGGKEEGEEELVRLLLVEASMAMALLELVLRVGGRGRGREEVVKAICIATYLASCLRETVCIARCDRDHDSFGGRKEGRKEGRNVKRC